METYYKVTYKIFTIVKESFLFELGCFGLHSQNHPSPLPQENIHICPLGFWRYKTWVALYLVIISLNWFISLAPVKTNKEKTKN